jgi:hypothetical protein
MGLQAFRAARLYHAAALVVALSLLLAACSGKSSPTPQPSALASTGAPVATGVSGANASKVDNVFLQLLTIYQTQGLDAARKFAADQGLMTKQDEVRMTVVLDSADSSVVDGTALAVGRLGGRVTSTYGDTIEMVVPVQTLLEYAKTKNRASFFADLADFSHVKSVRRTPVAQPAGALPSAADVGGGGIRAAGGVSEGVALTGADKWQAAGITGKGVKVGVIDGSFNNYKQVLGGAKVTTKSYRSDGLVEEDTADAETVHGTACAEIVHEMAPDAELFLVPIDTPGSFIQAVKYLVNVVGVPVITTSVGFDGGFPLDGSGPLAKTIDAAKAAGVFFTISAGNEASGKIGSDAGEGHYTATFTDSDKDGWNDFPGAKNKNGLQFAVQANRPFQIRLNWGDWKQPRVNYDLYVFNSSGQELGRSDEDQSRGNTDPLEVIQGSVKNAGTYILKIKKVKASDPDLPFHIFFSGAQFELISPEMSLSTPADAKGVVAVAAINAKTNTLEEYSSRGPTSDGRMKPEIGAPDDVTSAAYATVNRKSFPGTSAAAPHMAGAAALYVQAFPDSAPDATLKYFTDHAKKPQGTAQNGYGAGLVFLDAVPQGAKTTPAPTKQGATPKPSGTKVATPTNAPRPTGTPQSGTGTIVFSDDFSSSSSGLPADGYQKGEYHIKANPGYISYATYAKSVDNAPAETYDVTARKASGADDAMLGLIVRWTDKDNYMIFSVFNDGSYVVGVKYQGSIQQLTKPGTAASYKPNVPNQLTVSATGTTFTFSINGEVATRVDIQGIWKEGAFGMMAAGGDKDAAEIAFKNFSVRLG